MSTFGTSTAASLALVALLAMGCEAIQGFEDFSPATTGGTANSGGTGGSAGSAGSAGSGCPSEAMPGTDGRKMLQVPLANAAGCFWVDETEVDADSYQKFLDTSPNPQSGVCAGNTFDEDATCMASAKPSGTAGKNPVVCVDWCDAQAYCLWAGKQLCNGMTTNVYTSPQDAADSLWYAACSTAGINELPYGQTAKASACNSDNVYSGTQPVGSMVQCVTPAGVKDLVGNVEEWTDECDKKVDLTDHCHVRGGHYQSQGADASCKVVVGYQRLERHPFTGFRCCTPP